MSGHSKLASTKHGKERSGAAKGETFTAIDRKIVVTMKEGGVNPANSSKLRDVIAKTKTSNVPNDTVDRGAKETAGDTNSVNYRVFIYEGYGPNSVAIIVDTLTDNRNRTTADVRSALTKESGNVRVLSSVSHIFDKKDQTIIDKGECEMDPDELMMAVLGVEAEDFAEEEDSFEILTAPDDFSAVREALEAAGIPMMEAGMTMVPQTWVELDGEDSTKKMNKILNLLGEDDDVQAVYHNQGE